MDRRDFLTSGMKAILAARVAPVFIGSNILMPVREIWTKETLVLTIPPALHIAKHLDQVFRWDEYGKLIADSMPWNEFDAALK